jgi:predicted acetyltransferase
MEVPYAAKRKPNPMTPPPMDAVTVTDALPAQAGIIQNLVQLYTHDFSEFWAGTARGDLHPDGRFDAYPLDDYWARPNWSPLLIWNNRVLAGFSLINDRTHSGRPANRNVGEFFIVRKYRGRGVGRSAIRQIFSRYPGSWEVAVARRNTAARDFWRKAINGAAEVSGLQEYDLNDERWNGPIFRFEWCRL